MRLVDGYLELVTPSSASKAKKADPVVKEELTLVKEEIDWEENTTGLAELVPKHTILLPEAKAKAVPTPWPHPSKAPEVEAAPRAGRPGIDFWPGPTAASSEELRQITAENQIEADRPLAQVRGNYLSVPPTEPFPLPPPT